MGWKFQKYKTQTLKKCMGKLRREGRYFNVFQSLTFLVSVYSHNWNHVSYYLNHMFLSSNYINTDFWNKSFVFCGILSNNYFARVNYILASHPFNVLICQFFLLMKIINYSKNKFELFYISYVYVKKVS